MDAYRAVAVIDGSKQPVHAPTAGSLDDAERDVAAIRAAQEAKTFVDLSWLTVNGENVTAAYVEAYGMEPVKQSADELLKRLAQFLPPAKPEPPDDST